MKIKYIQLLVFQLFSITLFSQIPVGEFREHLPFKSFFHVTVSPDYVYAATQKNLLLLDKNNNYQKSTLSKLDGLSEIGIFNIKYLDHKEMLVIVYNNSNIDFLKGDEIINVSDIKNKQIIGSKAIHSIYAKGDILFLATGFGIVLIDLNTFLIKDTWFTVLNGINYSVKDFVEFNNRYYISTQSGVFSIDNNDFRAPDFSAWQLETQLGNVEYNYMATIGNQIVVNRVGLNSDSIFVYSNQNWQYAENLYALKVRGFDVHNNELVILDWDQMRVYDQNLSLISFFNWVGGDKLPQARDIVFDGSELIWVADQYNGLVYYNRPNTYATLFTLEGPASEMVESMDCAGGVLATVPGSRTGWGINYIPPSLSVFKNQQWGYISTPFYNYRHPHDFNNVIVNPKNPSEIFIASWAGGLYKVTDGVITNHWDTYNSPLQSISVSTSDTTKYTTISGLDFDKYGNLWMTNSKVTYPLKVLLKDSSWQSFSLSPYVPGSAESVSEHVIVDSRNFKWITVPRQNKLVVFNDNNTLDDKSDDEIAQIDLNTSANIQTSQINCIVEDLNGNIWIGNNLSIKVVYNPGNVFTKQLYAKNILLEQNGYVQNLFEFESVTAIAVDGANRKWVGTSKAGVFLISENGTEQLLHFDEDNSPLLANQIISITIDQESGEVYFGTTAGIISYRGTATEGAKNYNDYLVFPNPVRESYRGPITVSGLMENSFCKIVDGSGLLVWQGYSNGGQLVWDGLDFNGKRPATGVYFVFASSETGEEKQVAKLLFIK